MYGKNPYAGGGENSKRSAEEQYLTEDPQSTHKRPRETTNHNMNNSSSSLGGGESVSSNDMQLKQKKRFVWPEDLHRDFVAAIFDVGLKSASPKAILELMNNTNLTPAHIKSHLQKYRLHRERAREEFLTTYAGFRPPESYSRSSSEIEEFTRRRLQIEKEQTAIVSECLMMQVSFQQMLRQSLVSQQQLHQQLTGHATALGMESPAAGYMVFMEGGPLVDGGLGVGVPPPVGGGEPVVGAGDGGGLGGGGGMSDFDRAKRSPELEMQIAMRSHMDMHRQLLLMKQDQVARYQATVSSAGALPSVLHHPSSIPQPHHLGGLGGGIAVGGERGGGGGVIGEGAGASSSHLHPQTMRTDTEAFSDLDWGDDNLEALFDFLTDHQ